MVYLGYDPTIPFLGFPQKNEHKALTDVCKHFM